MELLGNTSCALHKGLLQVDVMLLTAALLFHSAEILLEEGEVNTPSNREQRYAATDLYNLFDHKAEFIQIV